MKVLQSIDHMTYKKLFKIKVILLSQKRGGKWVNNMQQNILKKACNSKIGGAQRS